MRLDHESTTIHVECDNQASTAEPVAVTDDIFVHKLDIRIQGLPRSSVEEAEHRQQLFCENSKKMIHDIGNVEYFELCETTSKVQCSYRLVY